LEDENGEPSDNAGGSKHSIRIIEVTHDKIAEKVFDLSIEDLTEPVENGWQTYRSERLPSLYP